MNNAIKGALIVIAVLYIISPVDFIPGPIDDIVVLLLSMAATKGKKTYNRQ